MLTGNNIGPEGAASLAAVLPQLISLQHLDISGNHSVIPLDHADIWY